MAPMNQKIQQACYVIRKQFGWTGGRVVAPAYISLVRYYNESSRIVENATPEQAWSTTDLESAKKALAYVQKISGMDRIEAMQRFGICSVSA